MSSIDWQAYLDGSISDSDRAAAEELLSTDADARRELDALRAMRAAVRQQGLAEEVPHERLAASVDELSKPARRPLFSIRNLIAVGAVLIVGALVFRWVTYDPMSLNLTPATEIVATSSPTWAAEWVRDNTGYPAPVVALDEHGEIFTTRFGEGWACYDYEIDGRRIYLYMSTNEQPFEGAPTLDRNGRTYYLGKGVGWKNHQLVWYMRGADRQTLLGLADSANDEMDAQLDDAGGSASIGSALPSIVAQWHPRSG